MVKQTKLGAFFGKAQDGHQKRTQSSNEELSVVNMVLTMGNEVDLGAAALYLASDAGSWISGAELRIDGGASLRGKNFDKKLARESTKSKL
ncbi:14775_t:CDS:2 [Entrophospora sp. SA101]|nr:14775_t:CDS:2 [Entrophospora sp. SA101]CAJ0847686.1 225_t:CDS:2 [Entrophospora sp. SA101]